MEKLILRKKTEVFLNTDAYKALNIVFKDPKQKFERKIYRKQRKENKENGKRNNTHTRNAKS